MKEIEYKTALLIIRQYFLKENKTEIDTHEIFDFIESVLNGESPAEYVYKKRNI